MKNQLLRRLLEVAGLCLSLLAEAQDGNAENRLAPNVFEKCQFSIKETKHIKLSSEQHRGSNEYGYCSLRISSIGIDFNEANPTVSPSRRENNEQNSFWVYFTKDSNNGWHYSGSPSLLIGGTVIKKGLTQENRGDEITLVGQQLVKGYIAQGGPLIIPGVQILRITPNFNVTANLSFQDTNFEKKNPALKQLREAVTQELVEIVNSVQFEPDATGPKVRP